MGKKITQLATITEIADDDLLVGVDISDTSGSAEGTNKKFTKANLQSGLVALSYIQQGWSPRSDVCTYKSPTEIYVAGDVTDQYQINDILKFTQSTEKMFVITAVSVYDSGNDRTTLTFASNLDYSVSDSEITSLYWSNVQKPFGFPNYANCSVRAYKTGGNQLDLVNGSATKVTLPSESVDVNGDFDSANSKFVAPIDGDYIVNCLITYTSIVAYKLYVSSLFVNNTEVIANYGHSAVVQSLSIPVSSIVHLNAGDYVELFATSYAGVNTVDVIQGTKYTFMEVSLLKIR